MLARHRRLLGKSIAAMIGAVDVYNKPDFTYREETFAILVVNAWELLIKAFILKNSNNELSALYVREHRTLRNGKKSKATYIKRNRNRNPMTIGLKRAIQVVRTRGWDTIDDAIEANIQGLAVIRDNAIHLANDQQTLSRIAYQLGAANLQNFVKLTQEWFDEDFSKYNFYLLPLAFHRQSSDIRTVRLNAEQRRILDAITDLRDRNLPSPESGYRVLLDMEVRLTNTLAPDSIRLTAGANPEALPVRLDETAVRELYPWNYGELTTRLVSRYSDFCQNKEYHDLRKTLAADARYATVRLLDPANPNGVSKTFFSPRIIDEFDKKYTRQVPSG